MTRAALAITAAIVASAAIITVDAPASAQSDDDIVGRIAARLLDDGRVEFGWQPSRWQRVLPRQRYFPTNAEVDRWLNSSPVEIGGAAIGRINARLLGDGRIEFAFTPTGRERILTDARYFPTTALPNRWLRSTEITISASSPFIAISAGHRHTCAIRESGAMVCWGENSVTENSPEGSVGETDAPEGSYTAVSAGWYHTCAISDAGELECWGIIDRFAQRFPPEGSYIAVSTGWGFACAIAETFAGASTAPDTGELECWGERRSRTGRTTRLAPPEGRFRAISAGEDAVCGIRENGETACWGTSYTGQTTGGALYVQEQSDWVSIAPAPAGPYTAVSAGLGSTCGLRTNGEIACWGDARGRGATREAAVQQAATATSPMQFFAPEGSFTVLSVGGAPFSGYACAIRDNNEIACWGYGNNHERLSGEDAPTGKFTAVSVGEAHACAIRESGAIECWGNNEYGQATPPAR